MAFKSPIIVNLIKKLKEEKEANVKSFSKNCLDYALNNDVDDNIRDLSVDVAICNRDFKSVLTLTEAYSRTEYYIYRAYAYSRLDEINKIISLKLRFHQKYTKALDSPRNAFIITSMEFLLLYGEQNYSMAIATIDELEELIAKYPEQLNGKLFTSLILTLACQTYLRVHNFGKVDEVARQILSYAVEQNDPYFQSVALNLITTVLINYGEFRKAQRMSAAAILPTEETGLDADRASLLNNSANLELAKGDYKKTVKLLQQIYVLIANNPHAQAISAVNIAELHILLNNFEDAEKMLEEAINLETFHKFNLIEPYLLLSWICIKKKNYKNAQENLDIGKKIFEETGELRKKPNILYFQGRLDYENGKIDEAVKSYELANKASEELQNIEFMIKSQFQLAKLYLGKFNETKELAYYSSALNYINNLTFLSEEQFIPKLMCDLHILKGRLLAQVGKRSKAVDDILIALEIAERFKYRSLQQDIKELLRKIESDKSDEEEDVKTLMEKGILESEKITEILQKYEGFKFVKSPKKVDSKLQCVALVEKDTGVIKYRYATKHEQNNVASIVPSLVAAINMFSSLVFDEDIVFEELKEEDKELLIKHIEPYLLIIITDKITYNLKIQFERYAEEIKKILPSLELIDTDTVQHEKLDSITNIYFLEKTRTKSEQEETKKKKKITIVEKKPEPEEKSTKEEDSKSPTGITDDLKEEETEHGVDVSEEKEDVSEKKEDVSEKKGSSKPEQDSMIEELDKAVEAVEEEFKDRIGNLKTEEIVETKKDETEKKKEE
jgi:tetratricopeptide (TPR) repeat protein